HHSHRAPWLRAFVLGANDGLVSTSSLLMGVGAASSPAPLDPAWPLAPAGLVGGALSMAVGEYISVSSQRDAEAADVEQERLEQLKGAEAQLEELSQIYEGRGLPPHLARSYVAEVLTEKDVVRAHARDELGIDVDQLARPVQAAVVSAITFSLGAGIPLLAACCVRMAVVLASTTVGLAGFGSLAAWLGGAHKMQAAARVVLGGWAAMGLTFGIGTLFEAA
ncbi:hypothetical protein CHLNCDRAFT_25013, partial [Chlorella variabilis]